MTISIKNFSLNYETIYLSTRNKSDIIVLTISLTLDDTRLLNSSQGNLQLSEFNNDDSWIKGYSFGTYNFGDNNENSQSVTIISVFNNNINEPLYSIPGNIIVNETESIYTWKK